MPRKSKEKISTPEPEAVEITPEIQGAVEAAEEVVEDAVEPEDWNEATKQDIMRRLEKLRDDCEASFLTMEALENEEGKEYFSGQMEKIDKTIAEYGSKDINFAKIVDEAENKSVADRVEEGLAEAAQQHKEKWKEFTKAANETEEEIETAEAVEDDEEVEEALPVDEEEDGPVASDSNYFSLDAENVNNPELEKGTLKSELKKAQSNLGYAQRRLKKAESELELLTKRSARNLWGGWTSLVTLVGSYREGKSFEEVAEADLERAEQELNNCTAQVEKCQKEVADLERQISR